MACRWLAGCRPSFCVLTWLSLCACLYPNLFARGRPPAIFYQGHPVTSLGSCGLCGEARVTGYTGRVAVAERLACRNRPSPEAAPRDAAWAWALGRAESGLGTESTGGCLEVPCVDTTGAPHAGSAGQWPDQGPGSMLPLSWASPFFCGTGSRDDRRKLLIKRKRLSSLCSKTRDVLKSICCVLSLQLETCRMDLPLSGSVL